MRKLLILGAGGYGKTVADVAQQLGYYDKIAFLDDAKAGQPGVLEYHLKRTLPRDT